MKKVEREAEVGRKVEEDHEVDHAQNRKVDEEVVQDREVIHGAVLELDHEVDQEVGTEVGDQEVVQSLEVEVPEAVRVPKVDVDLDQNPGQGRYPSAGVDLYHVTILIRQVTS